MPLKSLRAPQAGQGLLQLSSHPAQTTTFSILQGRQAAPKSIHRPARVYTWLEVQDQDQHQSRVMRCISPNLMAMLAPLTQGLFLELLAQFLLLANIMAIYPSLDKALSLTLVSSNVLAPPRSHQALRTRRQPLPFQQPQCRCLATTWQCPSSKLISWATIKVWWSVTAIPLPTWPRRAVNRVQINQIQRACSLRLEMAPWKSWQTLQLVGTSEFDNLVQVACLLAITSITFSRIESAPQCNSIRATISNNSASMLSSISNQQLQWGLEVLQFLTQLARGHQVLVTKLPNNELNIRQRNLPFQLSVLAVLAMLRAITMKAPALALWFIASNRFTSSQQPRAEVYTHPKSFEFNQIL